MDTRVLARELLDDSVRQLPEVSPVVAVPARFHIARVLATWSKEEARELLVPAIGELAELFASNRRLDVLVQQAHVLAAATIPELMSSLPPVPAHFQRFLPFSLLRTMVDHGHPEAAYEYLIHFEDPAEFPHNAVGMVLLQPLSEDQKLTLARHSVEAWRAEPEHDSFPNHRPFGVFEHLRSFGAVRHILPRSEAVTAVRELVSKVRSQEDFVVNASIGNEVSFTSGRQFQLFELLDAVQELDPSLAATLVNGQPELAAAIAVFPHGQRSVHEFFAKQAPPPDPQRKPGRIVGGSSGEDFEFAHALLDSWESKDFSHPIRLASRKLSEELEENAAPKEVWYSTQEFRQALYSAGKFLGENGVSYSDEIPDREVRVLSRIELAAGLAGLPECVGNRASWPKQGAPQRPRRRRHGF